MVECLLGAESYGEEERHRPHPSYKNDSQKTEVHLRVGESEESKDCDAPHHHFWEEEGVRGKLLCEPQRQSSILERSRNDCGNVLKRLGWFLLHDEHTKTR